MSKLFPDALRRVAELDADLGAELERDLGRLVQAARAVTWAQDQLPALVRAGSPGAALQVLVDRAREVTEAPGAWALQWSGELDALHVEALAMSGDTETTRSVPSPDTISRSVVGQVIRSGDPAWSDDAATDERYAGAESVQSLELRSVGCIPVGRRGVLYVHDPLRAGRFHEEVRVRLVALCRVAAPFLDEGGDPSSPGEGTATTPEVPGLVGETPPMRELRGAIAAFAPMPWPALILGETGTGKELVAHAMHTLSPRADAAFVPVNCGAIPENLAESILFGHVKGAFTGAERTKEGVVERVAGGTLFLDEVGELPAPVQVKLLRLLQEGTYERVGDDRERRFEGRVVAATLRNVDRPGERGPFREDLYHRLGACVLRVPPLRDRRGDIPALAHHLLGRALGDLGGTVRLELSADAVLQLRGRAWPGNVRDLENALRASIARALAIGARAIGPEHLLDGPPTADSGGQGVEEVILPVDLTEATEAFQKRLVYAALEATDGHRTRAAEMLGVSRQWLHRLVSRWESEA